jgi:hypothetical protein
MNNSESFSNLNMDDLTFATWPRPYPYPLVPQSAHPDLTSEYPSTAGSYVPDSIADDDVANLASGQCFETSTCVTYPAVLQNILDPWFIQALGMFLSCICHDPSYSPDVNSKPPMQIPRTYSRNGFATHIGQGSLPLPPTRWPQNLT